MPIRKLKSLRTLLAAALIALTAVAGDGLTAPPQRTDAFNAQTQDLGATTSIIVRAHDGASLDAIERYAAAHGLAVLGRRTSLSAVEVDASGIGVPRAIAVMALAPGAAYTEPVYHSFDKADTPADPLFARERPYLAAVHAPEAWDIETGRPETLVAVLDTGVDLEHPDLQGRIWTNAFEIPDNEIDDDANGCIDDVHGCAFVDFALEDCDFALDGDVDDDIGHGTFVSGIIAANGNNAGMVGVARNVTILPVKVLDCEGRGTSLALAEGIDYAARVGAKAMNVSLGGPFDSMTIREAVTRATHDFGALVVAASGNTGKSGVSYPARYPDVLAVGAATYADPDKHAAFSSWGSEVDVAAVGERIVGTVPAESCAVFLPCVSGNYAVADGTSFSAPQVTGLVALIASRRPGIPPSEIINLVKMTADAVPADRRASNWAGAGRINMLEAIRPAFRLGVPAISKH